MKTERTELVFILDKSGSMSGLEKDTIGGFNSMLEKQRTEKGACNLTTVLFDNTYQLLHDRLDIKAVKNITENEYYVGGSTALLDAIGLTISKIKNVEKFSDKDHKPSKVLVVIITDGEENASKEYTQKSIKKIIEERKKNGWEFIFLGANIDTVETAKHYGIKASRTATYLSDSQGTELNFKVMSNVIKEFRTESEISESHFEAIREDVKKRK